MNLVDCRSLGAMPASAAPPNAVTRIGIRPEDVRLDTDGTWPATVDLVERLGAETIVHVRAAGGRIQVRLAGSPEVDPGACVRLSAARLHYFDEAGRRVGGWSEDSAD